MAKRQRRATKAEARRYRGSDRGILGGTENLRNSSLFLTRLGNTED